LRDREKEGEREREREREREDTTLAEPFIPASHTRPRTRWRYGWP